MMSTTFHMITTRAFYDSIPPLQTLCLCGDEECGVEHRLYGCVGIRSVVLNTDSMVVWG